MLKIIPYFLNYFNVTFKNSILQPKFGRVSSLYKYYVLKNFVMTFKKRAQKNAKKKHFNP